MRVERGRADLAAGRLWRALSAPPVDATCPAEARGAAVIAIEAASAVGDVEAARRYAQRISPPVSVPALFGADGPVKPFQSPADARTGYARAVAAYLASHWALAGQLGLAVGASGGPLAPEGFILAARSAERAGDAARAARNWARAYRAGCAAPGSRCYVQPPRDDLFGRGAYLGTVAPWNADRLCSRALASEGTFVHGNWLLTSAKPESPGRYEHVTDDPATGHWHVAPIKGPATEGEPPLAYEVREVPSRTLLDHIEPPFNTASLCMSPDGRHWVAELHPSTAAEDARRMPFLLGTMGAGWRSVQRSGRLQGLAEGGTVVTDEGAAVVLGDAIAVIDPRREAVRYLPSKGKPGEHLARAYPGGPAAVFVEVEGIEDAKGARTTGVARYDVETGERSVLLSDGLGLVMGPADSQNRLFVRNDGKLAWIDGKTGKTLAATNEPNPIADFSGVAIGRTSAVVTLDAGVARIVDVATGKQETVTWLWDPWTSGKDGRPDLEEERRVLGRLPVGTSTWSAIPGWTVSPPSTDRRREQIEVDAPGRGALIVVLSADLRGAMVVDGEQHFEILGHISPVFRASASCGDTAQRPTGNERAWPLEVCGAAFEQPGLTEAWFRDLPTSPPSPAQRVGR